MSRGSRRRVAASVAFCRFWPGAAALYVRRLSHPLMNTQPNRWKTAFIALAIAAVCATGYLALQLFDRSATLGMLRDGFGRREAALSVLRKSIPDMLRAGRPSQQDILAILQKNNQRAPITSSASAIEMDLMRFRFAPDGSLDRIEQTDGYGFRASDTPTNRPTIPER